MIKHHRLLRDCLIQSAAEYENKDALVVEGQSMTYGELYDSAMRIAAKLVSLGVKRGDRVGIYMDNTIPCIVSLYGVMMSGGAFFIINPQTKAEKLQYILEDSEAAVLFSDTHLRNNYTPATENSGFIKGLILSGDFPEEYAQRDNYYSYSEIVAEFPPLPEPVFIIPNDLAAFIYTSGSTGTPKGVMHTNQSMLFAAFSVSEYLRLSDSERIILFLPMAFDYGLYQLLLSVAVGATLVVERSFIYPSLIYKRMEEQEVTVFPGVPTVYTTVMTTYRKSGITFPKVRKITNTAAKLPSEYISTLKEVFPNALIFKMYGLTECKRVSYLEPEILDEKIDSVGKAIPGTEIFIQKENGERAGVNEPGILYVRGPHVMAGYWKRKEQTEKMLRDGPVPGEKMLCTQDLMRMDEQGFLYFVGRTDDIIKTRGEKVSPVEVENVLHSLEQIKEAVVIGIPDELLGEAVVAFVTPSEGYDLEERLLKRVCTQRLENFMVPKRIVILEKMPLSQNGKIDKNQLKAWNEA